MNAPTPWFVLAYRLVVATGLATLGVGAWLLRAGPGPDRLYALTLVCYPLAIVGVPWLFRLCAPEGSAGDGSRSAWRAYLAALPPVGVYAALVGWIGGPIEGEPVLLLLPGLALLTAFGLLLCAGSDLARRLGPDVGQLLPMLAAGALCLSIFWGGRAVTSARAQPVAEARIAALVECNPMLVAVAALPRFDPLRQTAIYSSDLTPIGPYYLYRRPAWGDGLRRYLALGGGLALLAALLRWVFPAPSEAPRSEAAARTEPDAR